MCKAPSPPKPAEPKKPEFLRNRYLDEFIGDSSAVKSLKAGRSSLRIPLGGPDTVTDPTPTPTSAVTPIAPRVNARDPVDRFGPGGAGLRRTQIIR